MRQITLATLDPAAGYRTALLDQLPNATLVVDHFHSIKLANNAIDDVRRRVQQATLGRRGHKDDPLYRGRRAFLTGFERLTDDRRDWMLELLDAGDPDGEVSAAILARELLREVYAAADLATPAVGWSCSSSTAPTARSPNSSGSPGRSTAGATTSSPTTPPDAHRTAASRTSTCSSRRPAATPMDSPNHDHYRRRILGRHGIKWATVPTRRIRPVDQFYALSPHLLLCRLSTSVTG